MLYEKLTNIRNASAKSLQLHPSIPQIKNFTSTFVCLLLLLCLFHSLLQLTLRLLIFLTMLMLNESCFWCWRLLKNKILNHLISSRFWDQNEVMILLWILIHFSIELIKAVNVQVCCALSNVFVSQWLWMSLIILCRQLMTVERKWNC